MLNPLPIESKLPEFFSNTLQGGRLKILLNFICILTFSIIPSFLLAQSNTNESPKITVTKEVINHLLEKSDPSDSEAMARTQVVVELLKALDSSDNEAVSRATEDLSSFPSQEINLALLARAVTEVEKPHPDMTLLDHLIQTVATWSMPSSVHLLEAIRAKLNSMVPTEDGIPPPPSEKSNEGKDLSSFIIIENMETLEITKLIASIEWSIQLASNRKDSELPSFLIASSSTSTQKEASSPPLEESSQPLEHRPPASSQEGPPPPSPNPSDNNEPQPSENLPPNPSRKLVKPGSLKDKVIAIIQNKIPASEQVQNAAHTMGQFTRFFEPSTTLQLPIGHSKQFQDKIRKILEYLVLEKGDVPVLFADPSDPSISAEKLTERIAQAINQNHLDSLPRVFRSQLFETLLIQTDFDAILSFSQARGVDPGQLLTSYFDSINIIGNFLGVRIIPVIKNFHVIDYENFFINLSKETKVIGIINLETDHNRSQDLMKAKGFLPIILEPPSGEFLISNSEKAQLETTYDFLITNKALKAASENAKRVYPHLPPKMGVKRLLEEALLQESYQLDPQTPQPTLTEQNVRSTIYEKLALPFNPANIGSAQEYRTQLIEHLNEKVPYQERVVEDLVDTWIQLIKNRDGKGARSIVILTPPADVGISRLIEEFSNYVLKSEGAFLPLKGGIIMTAIHPPHCLELLWDI